jgi:ParB family chromosome partitioning protein
MEMALVENLQREDLNPIEEAEGFKSLIERYGMTQEDAALRVGRSRPAIANSLRLLELPAEIKDHVISGRLSAGHCRALLALSSAKAQISAANRIISLGLTVRQTEALVKKLKTGDPVNNGSDEVNYAHELSKNLSSKLGRGVKISVNSRNKGRLILDFYDLNDLDGLLKLFDK